MIHGRVRLDFCDALNGKVKERVEGNNAFTDAINSLLNKAPMGCDRMTLDGDHFAAENMVNFTQTALGGVLIFPHEVGDGLYEPYKKIVDGSAVSTEPTAYARYGAQDTDDPKTGYFSQRESHSIANGYQFVYEWGSAFGNGKIKTVCLTNLYGGEAYGTKSYFGDKWKTFLPSLGTRVTALGFWGGYFYYINNHQQLGDGSKIMKIRRPLDEMLIDQLPMSEITQTTIYTCDTNGARACLDAGSGKIYVIKGSSSSNKTMDTINLSDDSVSTTTLPNSSNVMNPKTGDYWLVVKRGDWMYYINTSSASSSGGTATLEKYNVENYQGGSSISLTAGAYSNSQIYLMRDTGEINGNGFIIDINDDVHYTPSTTAISVMDRIGVWQAIKAYSSTGDGQKSIGFQINPYYMASKFVLDSVQTKDSSLTMKLVYEVTHS